MWHRKLPKFITFAWPENKLKPADFSATKISNNKLISSKENELNSIDFISNKTS